MNFARTRHISIIALFAAMTLMAAPASVAQTSSANQNPVRGYDFEGPYFQFGVAVGQIDFDNGSVGIGSVDNNASGGFTMTSGYRVLPWLSGEINFTYLGGGSVEAGSIDVGNGSFFAITLGPKLYPLAAFEIDQVPEFIQPYGLIQIGGGEFHIENSSFDRSGFIARFILGIDLWATDNIGFFVEGGGHATDQDEVDGVGIFTVGGQYRF